jgi:hypothetical protein
LIGALQKDLGMPSLRLAYEPRANRVRIARAYVACPYNKVVGAISYYASIRYSYPNIHVKPFITGLV